jgi:outer membrane protein assembly factor BamB
MIENPPLVSQYRILGVLGAGGMGRVYLASSPGGRLVAVKMVHEQLAHDPEFRARFRREAAAARRVSGAFTAPILDADTDAVVPWLASLYVPSVPLSEYVATFGPVPEAGVRALGAGLAEALIAIHAAGLIHRDLKPTNVLMTEDGPLVIDFGISKALDGTQLTHAGSVIGTVGYMSPEQTASGRDVGPPSDVFSFGAVLAFAATGAGPFGTGRPEQVSYRVVSEPPGLSGVPAPLIGLIQSCLAKDAAMRPVPVDLLRALAPADAEALKTPAFLAEVTRRARHWSDVAARPVQASPPVPDGGSGTTAPAGLDRRRLLGYAATSVTALVLAGGAVATAEVLGHKHAMADALPAVPPAAPAWSRTPSGSAGQPGLALAGTTLLWAGSEQALAFDAADGTQLWSTGTEEKQQNAVTSPCGMTGQTLYGWSLNNLVGLGLAGQVTFSQAVSDSSLSGTTLLAISADTALLAWLFADAGTTPRLSAVDLSTGQTSWSRALLQIGSDSFFSTTAVAAGGGLCYLQDGTTTYALDLSAGTQAWSAANTVLPDMPSNLVLASGVLIVAGTSLTGLDPGTGRRLWTAATKWKATMQSGVEGNPEEAQDGASPFFRLVSVAGRSVFFVNGSGTAWAVDARTGAVLWTYENEFISLNPAGSFPTQTGFASASLVAIPYASYGQYSTTPVLGFVVLDAATGRELRDYTVHGKTDIYEPWQVIVSGDSVYAASDFTLCAFTGATR